MRKRSANVAAANGFCRCESVAAATGVICAKAQRQQQQQQQQQRQRLIGRPQESAQSEWKSTTRYDEHNL